MIPSAGMRVTFWCHVLLVVQKLFYGVEHGVTQREWNANMQLEGERRNEQHRIKQTTLKKLLYVAMPEVMVFPGNKSCYFDKSTIVDIDFQWKRFLLWLLTRFYQSYYGLYWINQQDQSTYDANEKENASLSFEVELKVQSHSQKLKVSHSIQTCQVGLS